MAEETAQQAGLPTPDPALERLNRFVGTWSMEGNLVGSEEKNIKGEATYRWLPGGFFSRTAHPLGLHGHAHRQLGAHWL
jgi:hypothetical protein